MATNGGLVLASAADQPFVAGVRPSHLLHFSPLISTDDGGHRGPADCSEGLTASPVRCPQHRPASPSPRGRRRGPGCWRAPAACRSGAPSPRPAPRFGERRKACGVESLTAVASWASSASWGRAAADPAWWGFRRARRGAGTSTRSRSRGRLGRGRSRCSRWRDDRRAGCPSRGLGEGGDRARRRLDHGHRPWAVSPGLTLASNHRLVSFGPASGSGSLSSPRLRRAQGGWPSSMARVPPGARCRLHRRHGDGRLQPHFSFDH